MSPRASIHGSSPINRIMVKPHAPAFIGFLDAAAERLGHRLVPEADADHPAGLRCANEVEQPGHPRQRLVDPRRRSGDQDRVVRRRIGEFRPERRSLDSNPPPSMTANICG